MKILRKDMCGYNGIEDPDDHLDAYLDWMNMQGASNTLKCKIFPLTLVGDARTWISGPSSYRELMERAEKYATAEEISGVKGKSQESQPSANQKKPWFNKFTKLKSKA
ncbi:hypothetical protein ACOSP7_024170 [Xanthoceras sorbifolium]